MTKTLRQKTLDHYNDLQSELNNLLRYVDKYNKVYRELADHIIDRIVPIMSRYNSYPVILVGYYRNARSYGPMFLHFRHINFKSITYNVLWEASVLQITAAINNSNLYGDKLDEALGLGQLIDNSVNTVETLIRELSAILRRVVPHNTVVSCRGISFVQLDPEGLVYEVMSPKPITVITDFNEVLTMCEKFDQ